MMINKILFLLTRDNNNNCVDLLLINHIYFLISKIQTRNSIDIFFFKTPVYFRKSIKWFDFDDVVTKTKQNKKFKCKINNNPEYFRFNEHYKDLLVFFFFETHHHWILNQEYHTIFFLIKSFNFFTQHSKFFHLFSHHHHHHHRPTRKKILYTHTNCRIL